MRTRLLVAVLLAAVSGPVLAGDGFKIVAHPAHPSDRVSRAVLSGVFLKKSTRWPDGRAAAPAEPTDDALRERFAARIHGRKLAAVKAYWNQLVFSGREVPPPEKPDEALVAWVRATPGAVAYVAPATATDGVKVLAVEE